MSEPPALPEPIKPPRGDFSLEERKWREGITRTLNILTEEIANIDSLITKGELSGDSYISVSDGADAVLGSGTSLSFDDSNLAKLDGINIFTNLNSFTDVSIGTISTVSNVVAPYDYANSRSRIALFYNPPIIGGSPIQWGWMGLYGSGKIGLFPETTNTGHIGLPSLCWKEVCASSFNLSTTNCIYNDENSGKFMIQWFSDSANSNRTVWFSDDSFIPFVDNQIDLGTTTRGWKKSAFAEIFPNATVGDLRLNSDNQYYNDGLKLWCETYTGRNWYVNAAVMVGGSPTFRPSLNNTIALGDSSHYWANMYSYNVYAGDIYGVNGDLALHNGLVPDGNISLGWVTRPFSNIYTNALKFSSINYFYQDIGSGCTFFQWLDNSSNQQKSVWFVNNAFAPFNTSQGIDLGNPNARWATIYTSNNVSVSDIRAKSNIEDLEGGLKKLNTIAVKSYTLNGHKEGVMYGFIAQDELERNPELVVVPSNYSEEDSGGELCYMPNNVLFLAVKAIQEISEKVTELEENYGNIVKNR